MNDDLRKFSQEIIASVTGGDTNANTGNAPVDQFARAAFTDVLNKKSDGLGALANEAAQQEKAAAEAARQAQVQKIKDKLDPNKYRAEKDQPDGGYSFYDPDGNKIDIKRFSQVTGVSPAAILKDSDNPFDRQYVNDYQNTRELITAIQNGDTDTINSYRSENANIGAMKPEDLMRELIKKYPHIYGGGQYADSYRNNNNPLLRYNLGGGMTSGGSGADNNYGFSL